MQYVKYVPEKRKDIAVGISLSNSWYGCDYQVKAIALNQSISGMERQY
jgi:hypothetical protein